jgi:hypothetical protein
VAECGQRECAALAGHERHVCIRACRAQSTCTAPGAPLRTLAYVTTVCEEVAGGTVLRQQLFVRLGNCAPAMLLDLPPRAPAPDPAGVCRILGGFRNGFGSTALGVVQRFSVLADGSALVVELNNGHSLFPPVSPEAPEEGIFLVQADGSGTRRVGAASAIPLIVAEGSSFLLNDNSFFSVSPDGRTIAFSDLVPGSDGTTSRQIVAIDLPTARRTQVTSLPGPIYGSTFIENDRLLFYAGIPGGAFTVKPDGSELRQLPRTVAIEGSQVQPVFGLAGGGGNVVGVRLPGEPLRTYGLLNQIPRALPRRRRRRPPAHQLPLPRHGRGVRPRPGLHRRLRRPPRNQSDGRLSALLGRSFRRRAPAAHDPHRRRGTKMGCNGATPPGTACTIAGQVQDRVTGVVGFVSSCDPVRRNPYGFQVFTLRPDGTGLRQVTDARGLETLPDGRVRLELPGPVAYSAPLAQ